jgi:hypothetical protein
MEEYILQRGIEMNKKERLEYVHNFIDSTYEIYKDKDGKTRLIKKRCIETTDW